MALYFLQAFCLSRQHLWYIKQNNVIFQRLSALSLYRQAVTDPPRQIAQAWIQISDFSQLSHPASSWEGVGEGWIQGRINSFFFPCCNTLMFSQACFINAESVVFFPQWTIALHGFHGMPDFSSHLLINTCTYNLVFAKAVEVQLY